FRTHLCDELIGIAVLQVLVLGGDGLQYVQVLLLGKEVQLLDLLPFGTFGDTGLYDHIPFVVDDHVQFLGRKPQEIAYLVGKGTEIPDMGHGHHQVDVSHTVPTDLLLGNLHATTVTDDSAIADALVLATGTFVILYRTEYALAEQAITLGLVRSVVDGFRL